MKIHLIDGTYELFRGFYGPPPRQAPDGRELCADLGAKDIPNRITRWL